MNEFSNSLEIQLTLNQADPPSWRNTTSVRCLVASVARLLKGLLAG